MAHDLWLVPASSGYRVGTPAVVQLASGMDFPHSEHAPDPAQLSGRVLAPDGAPRPLSAWRRLEAEKRSEVEFTPEEPGAHLLYVETQPKGIELDAQEFNEYLLSDGLAHVLAARLRAGEDGQPATERYSKYAKALLAVSGSGGGPAGTWRVGQKLEIVPQRNPLELRPGQCLEVQVLFDQQPLAHANLCWDEPGNGADFSGQVWTDGSGRALVPIARPGLLTLRLIHMTRPRHEQYEWESFWASFTFTVAP